MDLCRGAYDGRGNAVVKDAADIEDAVASLGGVEHGLYAERWAPFVKVSNSYCLKFAQGLSRFAVVQNAWSLCNLWHSTRHCEGFLPIYAWLGSLGP